MSAAFGGLSRGDAFRQRSWRRLTVVISVTVHVAAGLAAVAYSFWHVEELSPPTVTVTFVSAAAAPPPPPPPPPLGGGAAPKRPKVARPRTEPAHPTQPVEPHPIETPIKAPVVEAPKEKPAEAPSTSPAAASAGDGIGAGSKNGVAGGVKGGVAGGVVGGVVGAPPKAAAKFLPPQMGAQLKISGPDPDFPALLRHAGASYLVMAKICVSVGGAVDNVTIQKHADPSLDANVASAVKGWRFRPATANGTPVPFCYFGRFEFKSD
jgi:protein TonB